MGSSTPTIIRAMPRGWSRPNCMKPMLILWEPSNEPSSPIRPGRSSCRVQSHMPGVRGSSTGKSLIEVSRGSPWTIVPCRVTKCRSSLKIEAEGAAEGLIALVHSLLDMQPALFRDQAGIDQIDPHIQHLIQDGGQ